MVEKQWQFLKELAKLIQYAERNGLVLVGGELYRTQEQQEIYVKQGKSKTMNSYHLKRLAIDLLVMENKDGRWVISNDKEKYKILGEFWKSLDPKNVWGGDWGWDLNHFEKQI